MKLGNKIQFGVDAVVAGQKSASLTNPPMLIANSTAGKFTISSAVSKAMRVAAGDYVMFLNNIAGVEAAVQARVDDIVTYAAEHGYDLDTAEGYKGIVDEFTQWFIAKGVPQYKSNGTPLMSPVRFSKSEKEAYIKEHAQEIVVANHDALVAEFGDLSDDELATKLTYDMVESPKMHSVSGSKVATTAKATGVGLQVNFTDTYVWNTLKADLGDTATEINRTFKVSLDDAQEVDYNNGHEIVKVMAYPFEYVEDTKVSRKGDK